MSTQTYQRAAKLAIGIVIASLLGFGLSNYVSVVRHLEVRTQDIRLAGFAPTLPRDERIVVAAINEETLTRFPYRSPVDRMFLANLLKEIESKGAKAIYLDVLLDQPTEPQKDLLLYETIRRLKTPTVIGYTDSSEVLTAEQKKYMDDFVPANMRGKVNLATDPFDGTVRWLLNEPQSVPNKVSDLLGVEHDKSEGLQSIAWRRSNDANEQSFAVYPSHAIPVLLEEWIRGKVVLVGAVLSITDRHRTPFAVFAEDRLGMMSGVEIFAHQLSQILDKRTVPELRVPAELTVTFLLALVGGLIGLIRLSMWLTLLLSFSAVIGYWILAMLGFESGLPMLPLIGPTVSLVTGLFLVDFLIGKEDRDRRKFIQSAFSRYLAPSVVEQLIEKPDGLSLTGNKRSLSFIFTDIEGFTTLSEKMQPEDLSNLLNEYLDGMCAQVQKFQGVVDKFIGDSVMCFFNAPIDQPDHADRAIACALALDKFSEEFRIKLAKQGIELGMTRIGVHSGEAVVGNFGSLARMDFTALGDTVNAASRTEGVNKYFGTRICVTENTIALQTTNAVAMRPIGHVVLKGKHKPVNLYEPVSSEFANSSLYAEYLKAYEYLDAGDLRAISFFNSLLLQHPDDPLIKFHAQRLAHGHTDATVVMGDK
jgi:class 3 adenylate cyclase/CHASE2 domain-containing sensor protein